MVNRALPQEGAFGPRKTARCTGSPVAGSGGKGGDHWPVEMQYVSSMQVDDEELEAAETFVETDDGSGEESGSL